jgi:predicted acylesterase/phospholipase RssA
MIFAMSKHNMNASTPRIFRSYQGPANQMPDCTIWEALRATMAHPDLFKSIDIGESSMRESFVGGDLGCSNPIPHVLAEVGALFPNQHVASIICIGAGHTRTIHIPKPNPLQRILPTNVLIAMKNIATDSERVAEDMAMRFQDTPNVYFRFSVDQGLQNVALSHWQRQSEVVSHTRGYMQKAEVTTKMSEATQAIQDGKATIRTTQISKIICLYFFSLYLI